MGRVEGVPHQVALHAQVAGQAQRARTAHLLQRDMQHQRAALAQGGRGAARPAVRCGVGFQSLHDGRNRGQAEVAVDLAGYQRGARFGHCSAGRARRGPSRARRQDRKHIRGSPEICQARPQTSQRCGVHQAVGQARSQRLGAIQYQARQGQVFPQVPGAAAEKVAAAHVREQTDLGLRHRHPGALGHDAHARTLGYAHAAPHHDAVHKSHKGLGIGVDQVVQAVLLGKEVLQLRVARQRRLVEKPDVATGAEGAEWFWRAARRAGLAHAPDGQHTQQRVVAPGQQCRREVTDHGQRQGIQRPGTVKGNKPGMAVDFANYRGVHGNEIKCIARSLPDQEGNRNYRHG